MATSVAAIAHRKMLAAANNVRQVGPSSVGAGALAMKRAVEASRDAVTSGGRLRGVGAKGAKLGVRYDIKGTENPTALLRATGPWQLIERNTKAHWITPKGFKGSRASRGLRAAAPGASTFGVRKGASRPALGGGLASAAGGPRAYAHHPGTKGKAPWAKGIEAGKPLAVQAMSTATRDAALKGFRS